MEDQDQPPVRTRFLKTAIYGSLFVFLAVLFFLKPYLPSAIYYNFADIDDYKIFSNRVVKAASPGEAWPVSKNKNPAPNAETQAMLDGLKTTALMMIDHGEITYEQYFLTGGQDEISGSFSMAKSIVSLLTGFAIQDKAIQSVDDPIENYFPNWSGVPQGKITIKDLLTMSSGLDWNESYSNPFSVTTEAYYGDDLFLTSLKQRLIRKPGTFHQYQSGTTQLLGFVVVKATNKTLSQYASEKLWVPMGAEKDALWSLDHDEGMEKAYCCFNARARDFARIGELVLNHGQWKGKQLLNADYIQQMTTANQVPDESGKPVDYYGYQWWILKTPQGDIPYARGILGQYIIVIPQKNRVVVRLGMKRGKTIDHHPEEVRKIVEWALQ
jgi:CubicO group peptidase (beta-lactamase class C family)